MGRRLPLALVALLAPAAPAAEATQHVTIVITSVNTVQQVRDTKPLGKTNPGDAVEFKDLFLNVRAQFGKKVGKPVGWDAGVLTDRGEGKPQTIRGVATFPGIGTITYSGPMKDVGHGNTVVKVVAGTGGFKGATGTLTLGPGETKARNTFDLAIPNGNVDLSGVGGGVA